MSETASLPWQTEGRCLRHRLGRLLHDVGVPGFWPLWLAHAPVDSHPGAESAGYYHQDQGWGEPTGKI